MDYEIELNRDWVIQSFLIKSSLFNMDQTLALRHNGQGKWHGDGKEWKNLGLHGYRYFHFPFTNTLPVNRLKPAIGESCGISVVYIDIPGFRISKEQQLYTRIENNTYRFANDSGDFTADILMDEDGLAIHYPGLFERILIRE